MKISQTNMATERRILYLIENVELAFSFIMAGKEVAGGVLRAGNPFFFFTLSLAEEKSEPLVPKKSNYVS